MPARRFGLWCDRNHWMAIGLLSVHHTSGCQNSWNGMFTRHRNIIQRELHFNYKSIVPHLDPDIFYLQFISEWIASNSGCFNSWSLLPYSGTVVVHPQFHSTKEFIYNILTTACFSYNNSCFGITSPNRFVVLPRTMKFSRDSPGSAVPQCRFLQHNASLSEFAHDFLQ